MPSRAAVARYARALFDVALKESDPVRIEHDLSAFSDLMASNHELQSALTNPAVPVAAKRSVSQALAKRLDVASPVSKLLALLAEGDRLAIVPELLAAYRDRLTEYQQIIRAEITTASPLPPELAAQIHERLKQATGRQVTVATTVNSAIIGGVVTRIGSTVYDGSIATQLSKLKERLVERS